MLAVNIHIRSYATVTPYYNQITLSSEVLLKDCQSQLYVFLLIPHTSLQGEEICFGIYIVASLGNLIKWRQLLGEHVRGGW